ncbi:Caleosin-domain-containing protein [Parathielavia appendiculata]|uniref:Caleosin-domain-containing protein n=1 Tax=Parathielavia appendiculata TaxID=2587402 RepID=A0AAN6TS59_9PEZI|nr:Caleosin-domain-containing protein [Parathielavia appendiculata]
MGKKSSARSSGRPNPKSNQESSPMTSALNEDGDAPPFDLAVSRCPQTAERHQALDTDSVISKPAIARANLAVTTSAPDGSPESKTPEIKDYTVLQQHVLFWDRDGDGEIYPWDTYIGFRDLGFSVLFSLFSMMNINSTLSYPTRLAVSWWPDPWFRIYVKGIPKAKHGSDTGVYDREGRFVPQLFEDMFSKWDVHGSGSLSAGELWNMIRANRLAADPFGWGAAFLEWGTTWLMTQKDGRVSKEDLRQTYDGTIFWKIKEAREQGKGWNKGFGLRDFVDLTRRQSKAHVM